MTKRRFPLVSLPKLTIPDISAKIDGSFGRLASNRSATRGKPPVISRVLEVSCGILAITSPTFTRAPSSKFTIASGGKKYCAGSKLVPARYKSLPFSSTNLIIGFNSLPLLLRCFGSVTTMLLKPVSSSV